MDILNNLDLLSVGMAVAGIGILGFVVYFNNTKKPTSRSFRSSSNSFYDYK